MSGLAALPLESMDLAALGTFLRFYAAPYYNTVDTISDIKAETAKMKSNPKYSPRVIVSDIYTNATRDTSLGMLADFNLQNIPIPDPEAPRINSGGNKIMETWITTAYNSPGDPYISLLEDNDAVMRILDAEIKKQTNLLDQPSALSDKNLRLHAWEPNYMQRVSNESRARTQAYEKAEDFLYTSLTVAYKSEDQQKILDVYDRIIKFYEQYEQFAREPDSAKAAEMRKNMSEMTEGSLVQDWLRKVTAVFGAAESKAIVEKARDDHILAIKRGQFLQVYQGAQTPETLADNQNRINDATILYVLIGKADAALQKMPDLPNSIHDAMQVSGFQSIKFDVDEEAIRNHTGGNVNVYLQIQGRDTTQLLSIKNDGLQRDVTVNAGQDVLNALLEALSATQ
jgi:hypothetical protein